MKISYSTYTRKWLNSLDSHTHDRIASKIQFFSEQSDPLIFAKNIGYGLSRFRVGDYRIVFYIENQTIYIVDIDRRDKVYNK